MSGFVLGPLLGGTALAHVRWQWLLVVNAPIALIAWVGVRLGVPADHRDDLSGDALDLPGAVLSSPRSAFACYTLTSGVEHGWLSVTTSGRPSVRCSPSRPSCGTSVVRRSRCSTSASSATAPSAVRRWPRSARRSRWPA